MEEWEEIQLLRKLLKGKLDKVRSTSFERNQGLNIDSLPDVEPLQEIVTYRKIAYDEETGKKIQLKPSSRKIFFLICFLCCQNNNDFFWSNKRMMLHLGYSRNTIDTAKRELEERELIIRKQIHNEDQRGSRSYIRPSQKGWNLFWKVQNKQTPDRKKPKNSFEEIDEKIARTYYAALKRYYRGKKIEIKYTPEWAASIKKLRQIYSTDEVEGLIQFMKQEEFYLQNIRTLRNFENKTWGSNKKGNLQKTHEKIYLDYQRELECKELDVVDLPSFTDDDPGTQKERRKIWQCMFEIIPLKKKVKNKSQRDRTIVSLSTLCEELRIWIQDVGLRPVFPGMNTDPLYESYRERNLLPHCCYFLYLRQKYKNWPGLYNDEMLWKYYLEFWEDCRRILGNSVPGNSEIMNEEISKYLTGE